MRIITINENDSGQRLDKFLLKALPSIPTSLLHKYIRMKKIKINGKRALPNTHLENSDIITLYISDEFFSQRELPFLAAKTDIEIVYQDENILLVDKPSGLLVHQDKENDTNTLINKIQHYLYNSGEYKPEKEASFAPALCNRIDRNTSGLVISAKNAATLRVINQKIKDREIVKKYLCLVHGKVKTEAGTLKSFMLKDSEKNQVSVYNSPREGAKTAITKYKLLKSNKDYSLLEVELVTGRTHQIRAQMAYIGHPLVGDFKYGSIKTELALALKYQALCSYKLTFDFKTDAGHLNYLNGKTFTAKAIEFPTDF